VASTAIDTSKVELLEAEQEALADQALAEFAAAYGLEMPAAPAAETAAAAAPAAPAPPIKEMGPATSEG
jgi:hypothetical protein